MANKTRETDKGKLQTVPQPDYNGLTSEYQTALTMIDDIMLKKYVSKLSSMEIVPFDQELAKTNIRDNVSFFKITEMVYEKDEFAPYKFTSVFNALTTDNGSVFIMLDSDGQKTDFYMGVGNFDEEKATSSLLNSVKNAMKGQFPGIKIAECETVDERKEILSKMEKQSVAVVSCVANNRAEDINQNTSFVQGLEKLVLAMQGSKYTCIVLADSTTPSQLQELRKEYETIYSRLAPFASTEINYSSNRSFNYSLAKTEGVSLAHTEGTQSSETSTDTTTTTTSDTKSVSKENAAGKALKAAAGIASIAGGLLGGPIIGMAIGGGLGMLGGLVSKTTTNSHTVSDSVASSFAKMTGVNESFTNSKNYGTTSTEGYTDGLGEGMTLTMHDKTIESMLDRIDRQLERIDEFESLGMYQCAAYFLSNDNQTAEIAACTYKSLVSGADSGVETAAVNVWTTSNDTDKNKVQQLREYAVNLTHPVFRYQNGEKSFNVTPCSMVSGSELAIHMGLPRKSVNGLPVLEHADFGKDVVTYDGTAGSASIKLGKIFNMGSEGDSPVNLNRKSLTMHTFVTGSTGSGKSNTVNEILRQIKNSDAKFLVVEPAKGEYKDAFREKDVHVYGTNYKHTEMLRINPFSFPKGIHVYEHLDRLVEIFNACWPMYAAMPAVLKEAIEKAYVDAGWDLQSSENKYGIFPTFADVLVKIDEVMQQTQYSADSKGDYTGALSTRVKAMTTGINRMIFTNDELSCEELFENNVIIDLSRLGSVETKSLIMGLVIMKLQEYRISVNEMSGELKHLTVLEEAHNLLKRTSTEQSSEGANLLGKSVEMLANAIAEMRAYGEGFIIADQSPGLLDMSVIRNTNTKIVLRLPDYSDRQLVGKAMGLNDDQIDELSRLPRGVAAVSQNNWVEAVLCHVNEFKPGGGNRADSPDFVPENDSAVKEVLDYIMEHRLGGEQKADGLKSRILKTGSLTADVKQAFLYCLEGSEQEKAFAKLTRRFFNYNELKNALMTSKTAPEWENSAINIIKPSVDDYSLDKVRSLLLLIANEARADNEKYSVRYRIYNEYIQAVEGGRLR